MSRQPRETLKEYFQEGSLPTTDSFADLIESTLNIVDEGFDKTDAEGLCVHAQEGHSALLSFFRTQGSNEVLWSAGFGGTDNQFVLQKGTGGDKATPLLVLDKGEPDKDRNGRVGIANRDPQYTLDVGGTIASTGRTGALAMQGLAIPADGKPYNITPSLQGCQAFEVMAGVGYRNSGRFALLHAVAMNVNHPPWWEDLLQRKRRIRHQHAYYTRRCDRLRLEWVSATDPKQYGRDAAYVLQIRTECDYRADLRGSVKEVPPDEEVKIQVYLTRLWEDTQMQKSQPKSNRS